MTSKKLQCNFVEITLLHGSSPVNLLHICRTPLLKNTSQGMFLLLDCNQEECVYYYYHYYHYYYYLNQFLNLPQFALQGQWNAFPIEGTMKYFRTKRMAQTKTIWPWCWLYNDFFIKKKYRSFCLSISFFISLFCKKVKGHGPPGSSGFTHPI